jgi:perosamine synthetase
VEFHGEHPDVRNSYWMCSVLLPAASQREGLREHLTQLGIETRPLFYPVHTMPMYSTRFQKHPVAEDLGWRGINLPSYPGLTDEQVKEVATAITTYLK